MKRFRGQESVESVAAVAPLALVLSGPAGLGFKRDHPRDPDAAM